MKCPHCNHDSGALLIKCPGCGEAYDRDALESYQHLIYLLDWLDEREQNLGSETHALLRMEAQGQLDGLRKMLGLVEPAVMRPVEEVARELALVKNTLRLVERWREESGADLASAGRLGHLLVVQLEELKRELAGRSAEMEPPSELEVIDFAFQLVSEWIRKEGRLDLWPLRAHLKKARYALLHPAPIPTPEPAPPALVEIVPPEPAPRPRPVPKAPPKPRPPLIDWNKVWEKAVKAAVSGALLRGLLYLGAFMIVVSAAILVVHFWDVFPELVQLAFIAAVPASFYLAGWGVRSKLDLPQAGDALTGIGALLVAVDFAAVYQFGGLDSRVDLNVYWLGTSLFCTAVYALTAWRLPGEFFDYITLIGGSNCVLTLTRLLDLPLEWSIASVTASAVAMILGAIVLEPAPTGWADFRLVARRLPLVLIPASLAAVLFVPGDAALGQMGAFALAAFGCGLLAWRFPAPVFAHGAVWSSIGAVGFAMRAASLPAEWFPTVAAVLAPIYLLVGRRLAPRLREELAWRRGYLTALYLGGFALVGIAVAAGAGTLAFSFWPGVSALTVAALVLADSAYFFRRPVLILLAAGLFFAPFTLSILQWLGDSDVAQPGAWLMTAWAGLALVYLGLAVLLRPAEKYAEWLNLWVYLLAPLVLSGLLINHAMTLDAWFPGPTLVALGGVIFIYLASAVIHDSGRHPALSNYVTWLPARTSRAVFLWPVGLLLPVWLAVFWPIARVGRPWLGAALAGLALVYVGLGQLLARRAAAYRLPPHVCAYALAPVGIAIASSNNWTLLTTLAIAVGVLVAGAFVYRRVYEIALGALLLIWPFQLALALSPLTPHTHSLAYALLVILVYTPLGMLLDRAGRELGWPIHLVGHGLTVYALLGSLLGRFGGYTLDIGRIGVAVPLLITGLQVFHLYRSRRIPFAWTGALTLALGFWQALRLLSIPAEYHPAAWVGLAYAYLLLERALARAGAESWVHGFRWPLGVGAAALCALGLLLTAEVTITALYRGQLEHPFPVILAQFLAMGLTVLAAWLYRSRWPLHLEPWLAFFPTTLFFVAYGEALFGKALTIHQFGIVWSGLGLLHLLAAVALDRNEARYSHGLYLGGYLLNLLGIGWTLANPTTLVWTLGFGILVAAGSAVLVHLNRHRTWDEFISAFFGGTRSTARTAVRGAFLWLAAWPFPAWCAILLRQLHVEHGFQWLGLAVPALLLLGLAVWLRRLERTYAWPLQGAGHFYTAAGLILSASLTTRLLGGYYDPERDRPFVAAFILAQAVAVCFYAGSAWANRRRVFAHLAAWLSFFPYTLAWIVYGPALTQAQFALPWLGWAAVLLLVGYGLDRAPVRYAHGPYLAGYILAGLALAWSAPERLTHLCTLAGAIEMALISQLLAHTGRHRSFDDFCRFFWPKPGTVAHRAARTIFLFFAAYAFPVWLTQLLRYYEVPLAWRGTALALAAPIYIALGLAVRRVRSEYTWPLYSVGYALTVIGAAAAYERLELAIYVLALDALVYAVSAYIFRQAFWLYLSNILLPIITLLTLRYNESFSAPWVSGALMGLAFLYLGAGRWFDWRQAISPGKREGVSSYALPFYAPGYLLSAVALVTASGERSLALAIYPAGVVLYALSAWAFCESGFLYPAAWLAAVPYYLAMTLTPLASRWYGLGWLPLIVGYIAIGRFVFQKGALGIRNLRNFPASLVQPALPFYLLAYALSVSMIALSSGDSTALALALTAGAAIYLGSAALFRHPAWLYPGLLAAHLALAAHLPPLFEGCYITLPFLVMTWTTALTGYLFSRREEASDLEHWSFSRYLVTPSWAQPFLIFAALDLVLWQALALLGAETAIILATGNAVLLGLLALLWRDRALPYGSLAFLSIAVGYRLYWAGPPFAEAMAWVAGIGFGLYLLARIAEIIVSGIGEGKDTPLAVWPKPLSNAAVLLTGMAVVVSLPAVAAHTTAYALTLVFAGALYLAIAYCGRHYRLGYLGMAMLQVAWALLLLGWDVQQPQLYAIPAGLYFIGVGALEQRRSSDLFPISVECFGLAVLLLTSFIQSLNGAEGFPYFLLLLVEGLLVTGWGAWRCAKIPFFVGLGASAFNVVAQVVVLVSVYEVNRWFIIFGVGLALVGVAVFVERRREQIVAQAQGWRGALENWE